jgi:hypothetical protein
MFDLRFMISTQQIRGIRFFNGRIDQVIALLFQQGGLLVVPSGISFERLLLTALNDVGQSHHDING